MGGFKPPLFLIGENMKLILYKCDDAKEVIGKAFYSPLEFNITLRGDFDIINPTLKLKLSSKPDFNACVISGLNRTYFIDSVESLNNEVWQLNLSCDLLETYKAEILSSEASYSRSLKSGDDVSLSLDTIASESVDSYASTKGISGEYSFIMATTGEGI